MASCEQGESGWFTVTAGTVCLPMTTPLLLHKRDMKQDLSGQTTVSQTGIEVTFAGDTYDDRRVIGVNVS